MDKKIIKAMFANVTAKDELRPQMNGIYFEAKRCVASDGHILVVYNEGSSKFDGKIMSNTGEVIQGKYPNYQSVIPENYGEEYVRLDLVQLLKACQWAMRQPGFNENDKVVIENKGFGIKILSRILQVYEIAGELKDAHIFGKEINRASVIKGKKLLGVIMPANFEESYIDKERESEDASTTKSYENFINTYVFESWKKKPVSDILDWMD